MSGSIVGEALLQVTRWGWSRRMEAARELLVHGRRLPSVRAASATVEAAAFELTS
jgi:dolichol-phosphate mannosyltransferase